MQLGWHERAACQGSELDFYGVDEDDKRCSMTQEEIDRLVLVCSRCPVRRECAEFSVRQGDVERYGVWAGCLPSRRMALVAAFPDPAEAAQAILSDLEHNRGAAIWRAERGTKVRRKRTLRGVLGEDGFVHGRTRYYKHGCRCDLCLAGVQDYIARQRERRAV